MAGIEGRDGNVIIGARSGANCARDGDDDGGIEGKDGFDDGNGVWGIDGGDDHGGIEGIDTSLPACVPYGRLNKGPWPVCAIGVSGSVGR